MHIRFPIFLLLSSAAFSLAHAASYAKVRGHDISSSIVLENAGIEFKLNGVKTPLEEILANGGANYVRSRLLVNPSDGNYNLQYNLKLGKKAVKAGLGFYLDIHYSDTWADPGHQAVPAKWPKDVKNLTNTVYQYTKDAIREFANEGVNVSMVSIGNEISNGFLWPVGTIKTFGNIVKLFQAGAKGARDGNPSHPPRIMVHLNNGFDIALQEWWYSTAFSFGLRSSDFDIMAISFYPYNHQATFEGLNATATALVTKYEKDIVVAETDWPATCGSNVVLSERSIPHTLAGQMEWVKGLNDVLVKVPGGHGLGIFYWEPAFLWNAGLDSPCDDELLFDASGNAYSSIKIFT
ncbi:family 53 glycosyl hydrolase [Endogone sp. FLAS-F59071]|nr:family 53 glycosyl hydrolase [Endogone sp. FLAS-F59071]|eukprot:RUS14881.1 family 53 glycosyl hydrolase [Endogone sp. FLAS-F59071]